MPVSNVAFPLGTPTLSGNTITVDTMLQQPTRITRRIADLTLQRFIATRIFAPGGQVNGGAVIYDQAVLNELYTDRDVEERAAGQEYPLVTSSRTTPLVATPEDWGGKFFVTDMAKRRNDQALFNNQVTQLANTIVRKINQRAISTLEAALSGLGGAATFVGQNWGTVVTGGSSQSNATAFPAADFAKAQLLADVDELGVTYDLWLVNPQEKYRLALVYGSDLMDVLASFGIREVYASNRVTAGTAYAVASGQVGFLSMERGLTTETWYEAKTRRDWVQSSVVPVMGVTNPYAIKKITGLAG